MPNIDGKKFPYTEEGVKEAKKYQNSLSPEQEEIRSVVLDQLQKRKAHADALKAQIAEMGMRELLSSKRIAREPGKPKMGRQYAAYDKYGGDKTYEEWNQLMADKRANRSRLSNSAINPLGRGNKKKY